MTELSIDALGEAYGVLVATLDDLGAEDFDRPTRAEEWTVRELLFHLSLDAIRALAAFATTTDAEPDVDAVGYWRPWRPSEGDGGVAHARFVQRATAAFSTEALLDWWRVAATGAARAALAADRSSRVETQGHVLTVPDFVSTLVVEATVHHLDLVAHLPGAPPPTGAGLAETRRVLESLLGAALPVEWDDTEAALKGTGRVELGDADRRILGDRAAAIPLLG